MYNDRSGGVRSSHFLSQGSNVCRVKSNSTLPRLKLFGKKYKGKTPRNSEPPPTSVAPVVPRVSYADAVKIISAEIQTTESRLTLEGFSTSRFVRIEIRNIQEFLDHDKVR